MKKNFFIYRSLFLLFFLPFINNSIAQLTIDAGTKWVSDTSTNVSLDAMGIRYYADADTLSNVFQFSGAGDVYIEGSTVPNFRKLVIDKGSNQLLLSTDVNVLKKVHFQSGLFNLNNYTVALNSGALIENENETSRFIDSNYGSITISVNVNKPNAVNPGNIGAVITIPSYSGNITIHRKQHPVIVNGGIDYNTISRTYDILPDDNGSFNATLRLYYFDAEKNGLDESNFVIWQTKEESWKNIGASSRNTTLNYVEQTSINRFNTFTIAPSDSALPVHGLQLSGIWKNNTSQLTWVTLTEANNLYFDIERKYPQENTYTKIASVVSRYADGNSQLPTTYDYNDVTAKPNTTEILYRLKQVDKNGQTTYSNTTLVKPSALKEFIHNIYPTIITGNRIFIKTGNMDLQQMQVQLFDMQGKQLLNRSLPYQSQWLLLPVTSQGMYRLNIQSGEWTFSRSVIR